MDFPGQFESKFMTRTKNAVVLLLIESTLSVLDWFMWRCLALPSVRYGCIFNIRILAIHLGTGCPIFVRPWPLRGVSRKKNLGEFLLYPIIFAVVSWTASLAKTKGRNPWIWGGAAVLLSLLHVPQTALLSVLPVLVLLFIKLPATSPAEQVDRLTCARCAKPYSDGQHFCTGCGLDLSEAYSPEPADEGQSFPASPPVQTTMPSIAVAQPSEVPETLPVEPQTLEPQKIDPQLVEAPVAAGTPVAEVTQEPEIEPGPSQEDTPTQTDADAEPATPHVPWGTYDPGVAPTAAVMVSRGIERYGEEKYQEAIDQFTKAIALDPNYAEAWERRAEAYAQLGRPQQAEDDRRHLKWLDPSSSPG